MAAKKRKKILVVDDETELVEMMKLRLEASGYQTLTAYDVQEALGQSDYTLALE